MKNPLNRRRMGSADGDPSSAAAAGVPFPHYDQIDATELVARLRECSQVELTAIDDYERSHADRIDVLNKLRYLRGPEPVEGYDALNSDQIASGLAHADNPTLKDVREYELKFRRRDVVLRALVEARHHGQSAPS